VAQTIVSISAGSTRN